MSAQPIILDREPIASAVRYLPDAMRNARRWLLHDRNKHPYYVDGELRRGEMDAPADVARFAMLDQALDVLGRKAPGWGLGFALGFDEVLGLNWQGIDFDHLVGEDGQIADPFYGGLYAGMHGYAERSLSGDGLHVIGLGEPFPMIRWPYPRLKGAQGIECYSGGRYFTVTADVLRQAELVDLRDAVEALRTKLAESSDKRRPAVSAPRHSTGDADATTANIDTYCREHPIGSELERYGFQPCGSRWLSPRSTTGIPGVRVHDGERAVSFHASDDGLGTHCTDSQCNVFDSFDLAVFHDFNGDRLRAVRELLAPRDPLVSDELSASIDRLVTLHAKAPDKEQNAMSDSTGGNQSSKLLCDLEPDNLFEAPVVPPMDLKACFPPVLAAYADAQGRASGLDAGGFGVATLPVLAAATDRSVRVRLGPTHVSSLILWVGLVGRTGLGKTPLQDTAVAPLAQLHTEAVARHKADMADWMKSAKGERGEAPALQARYLTDATVEAVVAKLAASKGQRLLRHADEGSGWLNAMGRYANGGGSDGERSTWLTAWVGPQPGTLSRIERGDLLVPELGVSVLMGITPEKIREGYREATGEGVLGRTIIYLLDASRCAEPDHSVRVFDAVHGYTELVRRVTRERGEFPLSVEAQRIYDRRRREWRTTMTAIQDVSPGLASVLAKANENFGRLAALYEIAGEKVGKEVGETAALRAGALLDYLLRHAVVAHQHLFVQDTVVGVARAVATKILRDGPQDEFRVERRSIARTAAFEQADEPTRRASIDYLAGARWLLAPDTRRVRLGLRFNEATAWRVNPNVYTRFAGVAEQSRKDAERAIAALARLREGA